MNDYSNSVEEREGITDCMLFMCGFMIVTNIVIISYFLLVAVFVEYRQKLIKCYRWIKGKCSIRCKERKHKVVEEPFPLVAHPTIIKRQTQLENAWYSVQLRN